MRKTGPAIGWIVLAACSSEPRAVDSAPGACECPAAESPLAGRIVTEVKSGGDIQPMTSNFFPASCTNPAAELLSGGCAPEDQTLLDGNLVLLASTKLDGGAGSPDAWSCAWQNKNAAKSAHILITLTCLNPAQ